jgi:uncharacterized protein YjiS (DUF1127 family)
MADPFEGLAFDPALVARKQPRLNERLAPLGARLGHVIRRLQHGRMMAVLNGMSDVQLANIGIARSDIPQHAARLVGINPATK